MSEGLEGENVLTSLWFKTLLSTYKSKLQRAAGEGYYICVPQTCSLDLSPITPTLVDHHILCSKPHAKGEFTTLSGNDVTIKDFKVYTGRGFQAPVVSDVLSMRSEGVALPGSQHGKLHLCFLSRPLVGGLQAAASVDDLTVPALNEFLGFLLMSPDAEGPLARLRGEVEALRQNFTREGGATWDSVSQWLGLGEGEVGGDNDDGGGGVDPGGGVDWGRKPLALQFQDILSHAAGELFECCEALAPKGEDGAVSEAMYRRVLLCLQGDACRKLHATIMPHLRRALSMECTELGSVLGEAGSLPPLACAASLGIKPAYLCSQEVALDALGVLQTAHCPLSKLQALTTAKDAIKSALEQKLLGDGVDMFDVAIGADDFIPLMTFVLAQGFTRGPGTDVHKAVAELPLHLAFVQLFHHPDAGALHKSQQGYNLANWDMSCRPELKKKGVGV